MPIVYVDSEAADLIEAAVTMLEAALKARVKRADPNQIISNSLILQSHKLESFRTMLRGPEPPPLSGLPESIRRKAVRAAEQLVQAESTEAKDAAWELIRGITIAADDRRTRT